MDQESADVSLYRESVFSVPKMDCPSEKNLIRMALVSQAGIRSLSFDLTKRELTVVHQDLPDVLLQRLQPLKLGVALLESRMLVQSAERDRYCRSRFSVPQMDCPSEENLIRMALSNVEGIKKLSFDLSKREVEVTHSNNPHTLLLALQPLKLGAVLVESSPLEFDSTAEQPDKAADDAAEARTLRLLLGINAVMFIIELGLGLYAQSTGLIADSLDMFADAAVYGLALFAVGRAASMKTRAAHLAGWLQLALAMGAISEVVRRFIYGSDPQSALMIGIGVFALLANVTCLLLISGKRDQGVHMKASYIFSANDVIANLGVIIAGLLVAWFD